ncbi:hypothetical protein [Enterococcus sp. DIV0876]|uniref:hypothetical protein n=1 Tax=Enterococcus sp. DIV0876 TaxID=2774633 RepID=UPI003D2FDFEC
MKKVFYHLLIAFIGVFFLHIIDLIQGQYTIDTLPILGLFNECLLLLAISFGFDLAAGYYKKAKSRKYSSK